VRNRPEFLPGTEEAILSLADTLAIVSTPRHSAKLSGRYVSSAAAYAPAFFQRLREVTGGAKFWDPKA
jgi:hypothetical protein